MSFQDVVDAQFIAGNNLELLLDTLIVKGTFNTKNSPQFQNLYTEVNKNYQLQGEQYYIFGTILTQSEIELLFKYPQHIASWISSSEIAMSKTSELFSSTNDGSIANAFLHTYWNVLMVKKMSLTSAEEFATAHENYSENPIMHKTMDLYNNEMGRNFANSIIELSNKPNDWLAEQTKSQLIDNGLAKYVLFDHEYVGVMILYDDRTEYIYVNSNLLAWTNKLTPIYIPSYTVLDRRTIFGPIPFPNSHILRRL